MFPVGDFYRVGNVPEVPPQPGCLPGVVVRGDVEKTGPTV